MNLLAFAYLFTGGDSKSAAAHSGQYTPCFKNIAYLIICSLKKNWTNVRILSGNIPIIVASKSIYDVASNLAYVNFTLQFFRVAERTHFHLVTAVCKHAVPLRKNRILIKNLYPLKDTAEKFLKEFSSNSWNERTLRRLLKQTSVQLTGVKGRDILW